MFQKSVNGLLEHWQLSRQVLNITANMRFPLWLHPNCLWSQVPDGNFSYSRDVEKNDERDV